MHIFCHEEAIAIMSVLTLGSAGIKLYLSRIRAWFHKRKECPHPEVKS